MKCLPGKCTCVDTPSAIVTWALGGLEHHFFSSSLGLLDPRKHILWICGPVGSGKTSIAVSVACSLAGLGVLGAFYAFSEAHQTEFHLAKLFSTISLQLAAQNPPLQEILLDIIK
ncbi:hypothetical protein DL93DRAFT_2067424, partial [Clavulina sp. PMI_390]